MLDFQPLTLDMKDMVDSYTFKYGENSCQHSFVSSFCLNGKYGDMFCESENFLFTLRSKRCNDSERVYLFPHGDFEDTDGIKKALQKIFDDAHEKNCRVKFETLTERAKNIVANLFPEKFLIESSRDYAEYVYKVDKRINLAGGAMRSRRKKINRFLRRLENNFSINTIEKKHIPEIKDFQSKWLASRIKKENNSAITLQLENENDGIQVALDNFFALGLSGVVIMIDGKICGYDYGTPLSADCYDSMVQKADRNILDIYSVLDWEFIKFSCSGHIWLNCEEDVGNAGLRESKLGYKPEFMIDKFILTEC